MYQLMKVIEDRMLTRQYQEAWQTLTVYTCEKAQRLPCHLVCDEPCDLVPEMINFVIPIFVMVQAKRN